MSQNSAMEEHQQWMRLALELAVKAGDADEVPVGAVLVESGEIIGQGFNQLISRCDPTAHAEILALREGSQFRQNYRLPGTVLYVTIEPCTMCLGALIHGRVDTVVFGAREPRAGAVVSNNGGSRQYFNHGLNIVEGVLEEECRQLIQAFFRNKRQ